MKGGLKHMKEELQLLRELHRQKLLVERQLKCGIIGYVDATTECRLITQKEYKLMKKVVNEVHVTKDGKPRTISFQESKQLWQTKLPDGQKLYGKTIEAMYENLFKYYGLSLADSSLKAIFDRALDEKSRTENNNQSTIKHLRLDFKRFISKDFGKKNIKSITKADLKEYTQTLVNTKHLKKKAFLAYKGVLNLAFNYAIEYDVISVNPVSAIKNAVYLKNCDVSKALSEEKILSENEIETIKNTIRRRMECKRYKGYFINGYAMLISIQTGMRAAEICSLKWSDIGINTIHIHSQQLSKKNKGEKEYYYADWTKDEKGISKGGREFPLTDTLRGLLLELKQLQYDKNIHSEYVFCHEDGEWIKTEAYETCLRRLMQSLDMKVTNNHSFRMSLNSNIFIPLGIPVTERARLLGHSVETNLRNYSFARKDSMGDICDLLNQVTPRSPQNIIIFEQRKKPQTANLKAFN